VWPPLLRFSECPEFVTPSSTHALYAIGWKFKPPVAQPPAAVYGRQVVRDGAITIRAAKGSRGALAWAVQKLIYFAKPLPLQLSGGARQNQKTTSRGDRMRMRLSDQLMLLRGLVG